MNLTTEQLGQIIVLIRDNELIEENKDLWKAIVDVWKKQVDKEKQATEAANVDGWLMETYNELEEQ